MNYAILLSQTNQWREAVVMYDRAALRRPGGETPSGVVRFDANDRQPAVLEAAAHLGLGMKASVTGVPDDSENLRALDEYTKALKIAPNWDTAKYYYAYGLKRLGRIKEAKAAFTTLAGTATGPVVKAMALRDAR